MDTTPYIYHEKNSSSRVLLHTPITRLVERIWDVSRNDVCVDEPSINPHYNRV